MLCIAVVTSVVAAAGLAWLSWRWRTNYLWLQRAIIVPTMIHAVTGLGSALLNVYHVEPEPDEVQARPSMPIRHDDESAGAGEKGEAEAEQGLHEIEPVTFIMTEVKTCLVIRRRRRTAHEAAGLIHHTRGLRGQVATYLCRLRHNGLKRVWHRRKSAADEMVIKLRAAVSM
ncbi:hypothetical protein ARSEF4850_007637 [Beauveria asiatica]